MCATSPSISSDRKFSLIPQLRQKRLQLLCCLIPLSFDLTSINGVLSPKILHCSDAGPLLSTQVASVDTKQPCLKTGDNDCSGLIGRYLFPSAGDQLVTLVFDTLKGGFKRFYLILQQLR